MRLFWLFRGLFTTILICLLVYSNTAFSQDIVVFDQRKNLPLSDREPVYHDYYINAGSESGLKKGLYVDVVRAVPVSDPVQNKALATLTITVAKVQIIHVDKKISVARLAVEYANEDRPNLDYESIMLGDRVDLGSATSDAPKVKKTRTPAEVEKESEEEKTTAVNPGPPTIETAVQASGLPITKL